MERESLLQEYDETIQKQSALLKRQQSTIESLREELSSVHSKLISSSKQYQNKLETLIQQVHSAAIQDTTEESSLLKLELESALKEKELCQAENKRQALEVQRLRQEAASIQPVSGDGYQVPVSQVKEYERVILTLEEETQRLRSEMSKMEDEKMEALRLNVGVKKKNAALELQLEQDRKEIRILRSTDYEKEKASFEMKESYTNLNKQFLDQSEDLRILLLQTKALQKNKDQLSKVLMNVNERLEDAKLRVSESVRIAEDALVEKDAALLREKHALNEISRLETTITSLMEEAGEKAQEEILKIKDDYNLNIKSVSQEVVSLEMILNEKQVECMRVRREKDKIASELEQIHNEFISKKEIHQEELLNLHQRINSLENRIISLQTEKENMSEINLVSTKEGEQQREELLARIQELEQHLSASRSDCETLRIEYEELRRTNQCLLGELKKLREESKSSEKILKRQLRVKHEEIEELTSSSSMRLDVADSSYKAVLTQLNENLAVLQDNYSRLQSQMETQKRDYEERIGDISHRLQDNISKYKTALQSVHETRTALAVEKDLAIQYKNRIEELEGRLYAAEQRFSNIKRQSTFTGDNMDVT